MEHEYSDYIQRGQTGHYREHEAQTRLFRWADALSERYPTLRWLFAVPNSGKRTPFQGRWAKDEGLRAGVPDIILPARSADGRYIGLALELKSEGGRATPAQLAWLEGLRGLGWRAEIAHSYEQAVALIKSHLDIDSEIDSE